MSGIDIIETIHSDNAKYYGIRLSDFDLTISTDDINENDGICLWYSYKPVKKNKRFTKQESKIYDAIGLQNGFVPLACDFVVDGGGGK